MLDLSHNKLTSAACSMLSTALAKPQAARGWAGAAALGSRKDGGGGGGGGGSVRMVQTPAKGFNSCLQELNLSWNSIGLSVHRMSTRCLKIPCHIHKYIGLLHSNTYIYIIYNTV